MPKRKDVKLDEYGIGRYAYREMYNFCLQYKDKKKQLAVLRDPYNSPSANDMPRSGAVGDPTGKSAEKAAALSRDIDMIDQCAIEACGEEYEHLLFYVTNEDVPLHALKMRGMKMGEYTFRKCRRRFYYLLAKKKNIF